jgi:hypothetical protein
MPYTTRGLYLEHEWVYRGVALPTYFYVALVVATTVPTVDTKLLSELTQIVSGNGYTAGGLPVARNATDFDFHDEDDTNNRSELQIKDLLTSATGGPIPASGAGASYAVLTTDEATIGSRQVLAWWSLGTARSWLSGQVLKLADLELRSHAEAI